MHQGINNDLNTEELFRIHMAYTHYEFAQECEQNLKYDLAIENYKYSLSYDNNLSFVKEALKQLLQKLNYNYKANFTLERSLEPILIKKN